MILTAIFLFVTPSTPLQERGHEILDAESNAEHRHQSQNPGYLSREVQVANSKYPYLLLTPNKITKGRVYPLVLFLHGAGERGNDNNQQKRHFPELMASQEYRELYPAFVLAPQCPKNQFWVDVDWSSEGSTPFRSTAEMPMQGAIAALEEVVRTHPIDLDRITLTGLSMGGYGAWDLAMRHPYWFTSVIPICGGGDEKEIARLAGLPIQVWHGAKDRVVPTKRSRQIVEAIQKIDLEVEYFELPGVKHNSWFEAYRRKEFLNLLFSAKRNPPKMQKSSAKLLAQAIDAKEKIAFFGDSITQSGNQNGGYVDLIRRELNKEQPHAAIIPAGISGHKVPDLLARIDRDVIDQKATVVFVYIGINDVWHSQTNSGTPIGEYGDGLREIIRKLRETGAEVVLATPSVIGEKPKGENSLDGMLEEYAAVCRQVAEEEKVTLCDLRNTFLDYLRVFNPKGLEKGILTTDGVHLNKMGNLLVATEVARALRKAVLAR
ncbi:MAG: GDSL-type esterase/lipase family protein [Opitutales bacterium]|nr:GDSL-type esterase/lipase family protein [Opitutales bacterium]